MALPQPSGDFEWVQAPWGSALRCAPLAAIAPHSFSTRELPLDGTRAPDSVPWDALARALGVETGAIVRMRQVHCAGIFEAEGRGVGCHSAPFSSACDDWPEADIAISRDPSIALSVRVADCVPILLGDRRTGAVAAIHAGWRGTAAGAVAAAVQGLSRAFGSEPADVVAAIGPSIGPCCYEVGNELLPKFAGHPDSSRWFSRHKRPHLNLWRATRDQLERADVPVRQIHLCALCTADHPDLFHCYRRDRTRAGRLVAAIRSRGRGQG